jgi:hypothetical protein
VKRCKCGKKIIFGAVEGQHAVPLDVSAPTYEVTLQQGQPVAKLASRQIVEGEAAFLVSHFSTCPMADEFSRLKSERKLAIEALTDAAAAIAKRVTEGSQLDLDARSHDGLVADLVAAYVAVSMS